MFASEVHSQSRGPGPGLGLVTVILHYLSLNTQPGQLGNSCGYTYIQGFKCLRYYTFKLIYILHKKDHKSFIRALSKCN